MNVEKCKVENSQIKNEVEQGSNQVCKSDFSAVDPALSHVDNSFEFLDFDISNIPIIFEDNVALSLDDDLQKFFND